MKINGRLPSQTPRRTRQEATDNVAIELVPIDTLRANPRNPRTHSKKQLRLIAESIQKFGFLNPVIIDERSVLLAGHGRWEAAKLSKLPRVPAIRFDHLTPAQKRAYLVADNRIAEHAGWDRKI
jgi:ParB-like chromosome segregation protein Spo0J